MKLNTLQLENYRNYDEVTLKCHPDVNILIGENAQGKTNLLESIYTLALAKSHRTSNDKELIRFNADYAKIEGELSYRHGTMPLTMFITKKGKQVKSESLRAKSSNSIYWTPQCGSICARRFEYCKRLSSNKTTLYRYGVGPNFCCLLK